MEYGGLKIKIKTRTYSLLTYEVRPFISLWVNQKTNIKCKYKLQSVSISGFWNEVCYNYYSTIFLSYVFSNLHKVKGTRQRKMCRNKFGEMRYDPVLSNKNPIVFLSVSVEENFVARGPPFPESKNFQRVTPKLLISLGSSLHLFRTLMWTLPHRKGDPRKNYSVVSLSNLSSDSYFDSGSKRHLVDVTVFKLVDFFGTRLGTTWEPGQT